MLMSTAARTCVDARMCCTFLFQATHVISGAGPAPAAVGPCTEQHGKTWHNMRSDQLQLQQH
jgi:hypothetical protein